MLSPRVDNEFLKPFRRFFLERFDTDFIGASRKDPYKIAEWIRKEVVINSTANYSRAPLTPVGVFELRVADAHSADICFIAICRSFGIPARLDPATRIPQDLSQNKWHDVFIAETRPDAGKTGKVNLVNSPGNGKNPEYTVHYTLEAVPGRVLQNP